MEQIHFAMTNEDAKIIDKAREVNGASRYAFAKQATIEAARKVLAEKDA